MFDSRYLWWVYGDDKNVFGVEKKRKIEVDADDEEGAKAEALKHFPDMVITEVRQSHKVAIQ